MTSEAGHQRRFKKSRTLPSCPQLQTQCFSQQMTFRATRAEHCACDYSITSSAVASSLSGTRPRLGGLDVDHELVLGRRLHWQVGWLLAFENAIDVRSRMPELVGKIRPIGDQSAGRNIGTLDVDCGQLVAAAAACDGSAASAVFDCVAS